MFANLQLREHGTILSGDAGEFDGRCSTRVNLEIWNQSFDSLHHGIADVGQHSVGQP